MQIGCTRRTFMTGAAAGLFFSPAASRSEITELEPRKRWDTGNTALSPPSADANYIYFCGDRRAGALDPGSDAPVWQCDVSSDLAFQFRPRAAGSSVVFSGQQGLAVHAAKTGAALWQRTARIQTGVPMVSDNQIVLGDGHEIVALDLATGEEQWRHAGVTDTLANYAPVQSGTTVLAAPGDGRLYALDANTGTLIWQRDGRQDWQYLRQLRVHGDILVAGSYKEKLFGISIIDGRELWQFNAGNFINSHAVADGAAYLWSPTGFIYAVDVATGDVRWRVETTDYDDNHSNWGPLMAELVVVGSKLLALDMYNVLHVLATVDGTVLAHVKVPAAVRHAVVPIAREGLAFPTQSGEIIVTDAV